MKTVRYISAAHVHLIGVVFAVVAASACGTETNLRSVDDGPSAERDSTTPVNLSGIHSAHGWRDVVDLRLHAAAPASLETAVKNVVQTWNKAVGREILRYGGRSGADVVELESLYSVLNDDATVIYYDTAWKQHTGKSDGVLGTTVWESEAGDADYIVRGDIILNATDYVLQDASQKAVDPARKYDVVDAETVLLHEVGHLMGLDHVDANTEASSAMKPQTTIGLGVHFRTVSDGDRSRIASIYAK